VAKPNFLDLPDRLSDFDKARIVVLGVPYEASTTYGKGTADGPLAIIEASSQVEFYDEELDAEICDIGIATEMPFRKFDPDPERAVNQIAAACERLLEQEKFVVGLGGEHTVSLGLVQAFKKFYPDMWVLQLDAHSDLRDRYHDSPFNHACVMARVQELCPYFGVGIRSGIKDERGLLKTPSRILYAHEMYQNPNWGEAVLEGVGEPLYITIDLDFFDPAFVPSVGTPEPGGFGWVETLRFLRNVARARKIIGFDVVELLPRPGFAAADFFAARLVYKLLGYIFAAKT
jgi:agmatinase